MHRCALSAAIKGTLFPFFISQLHFELKYRKMSLGTVYCSVEKGEPLRTRAITPAGLIKYYKLDYSIGEPDEHFPAEFPAKLVPSFRYASGRILTESIPIAFMRKYYDDQQLKKQLSLSEGLRVDILESEGRILTT